MAATINRLTRRITVPQADLTFISGVLYELDVVALYEELRDTKGSEAGRPFPAPVSLKSKTILSGDTFPAIIQFINNYTIEFEDTGTAYTVKCVKANHNILDVMVVGTSEVSINANLTAGLIKGSAGASASDIWNDTTRYAADTMGGRLQRLGRKV